MKFGLTPAQYDYLKLALKPLEDKGAVLWCFGSRARGDHKEFSDVDILVQSTSDLRFVVGQVNEVLIEGPFPFKVDLVLEVDFAKAYRAGFDKDKKLF